MNCKHVQELLPLYVGREIADTRAQLVAAHLKSCAECAGSADEYRQTRQLLQQFAPPSFDEAVYTGIRQRVLREIESEATTPTLTESMTGLFRPRLKRAIASALLLAVSVLVFYLIADRSNDRRQVAERGSADGPPPIREKELLPSENQIQNRGPAQRLTSGIHQTQQRKVIENVPDRTSPATVDGTDQSSLTAEAAPVGNNLGAPHALPSNDSITSRKPLRMEMQTNDPNIRIIWFSYQPTKQDSPGKFSKGS